MRNICLAEVERFASKFNGRYSELPFDGLTPELASLIRQFSGEAHVPSNYIFGCLLSVIGTAMGRKVIVRDGAWWNFANLYICLVGTPGDGKSPACNYVLQPVESFNAREHRKYMRARRQAVEEGDTLPPYNKMLASNVTVEKFFNILSRKDSDEYRTGLLLRPGEINNFFGNVDKYSGGNSRGYFNDLYTGQSLSIERMYDDDGIFIERPFASILGDIQPRELGKVFRESDGSGFNARWLFLFSNGKADTLERNQIYTTLWCDIFERALELPELELSFSEPALLLLCSNDAEREAFCEFLGESNPELAEFVIKQSYTVRRLAAIIHCANALSKNYCPSNVIEVTELEYAETLVDEFAMMYVGMMSMRSSCGTKNLSSKALIRKINERWPIRNISDFSQSLGLSRQYVSRCLLSAETAETAETRKEDIELTDKYIEWLGYVTLHHPALIQKVGRVPTKEEVALWLPFEDAVIKKTLQELESYPPGEHNYSVLFSELSKPTPG